MNKLGNYILNILTFMLLFLAYISYGRLIEIGNNLTINLTFFIFPLVFLVLAIINNFYGYKDAKKTIKASSLSLLVFVVLIMILNLIPSNVDTVENEILFKNLFTPNNITLLGFKIFYPDLLYLGLYTILSFVSGYIMIAIYNVIKEETKEFIGFYLSIFIALVLFTIILISVDTLLIQSMNFKDCISYLTAGFIVVIVLSVIILIINSIINLFKKSIQN